MAKKSPGQGPGDQGKVKKSVARPKLSKPPGRTAKAAPTPRPSSARAGARARPTKPKAEEPKEGPARARSAARPSPKEADHAPARKVAPPRKTGTPRPKHAARTARVPEADAGPQRPSALSEEDEIRSAKYLPRDLPSRLFEEERFLFPESYGQNRIRLLVKDPDWLFSHWDVSPETLAAIKETLGERAMSLARLTLRVSDPVNGGSSDILLPPGARSWYVRTDRKPRSYKAELGLTLTSGEFRRLAESNTVVTPRVGPSPVRATRRVRYGRSGEVIAADDAASWTDDEPAGATGPWGGTSIDATQPSAGTHPSGGTESGPGGASDVFGPGGASDVHRR